MKKLKIKVFGIIFSLLTIFTLIIISSSTIGAYIERKNTISNILTKMPRTIDNVEVKDENNKQDFSQDKADQNPRRIYLDFTLYTIILDNNGNFKQTINHTNNDEVDEEYIKNIAEKIINNHNEDFYIGNLYTNKYAYIFTPDNTLIIMDNTEINKNLITNLIINILIFLFCEILIFIFTSLITKWIITPIKNSFEKQKIFVADASHELKTPLSVMIASADAYFNDKNDKWVKNMKNESERMIKLVTELLDLAKTEKEQEISMKQNNLSDIIESSILTFESLFYENNIKLEYDIKPNIEMLCNENSIIELIHILIDNAISHCNKKGKVLVNLYKKDKKIVLEIKNTGSKIKKEDEEKIFERFYKIDSSRNRNTNNYGLGLAIAKNIVEQHNGTISAHTDDEFTTFKIIWNQK